MSYAGPERRQYKVLVTRNTEYHMRGERCVGVRCLDTRRWNPQHVVWGAELLGCMTLLPNGGVDVQQGAKHQLGARLCFSPDVMTSPLLKVRRPSENTVVRYPTLAA